MKALLPEIEGLGYLSILRNIPVNSCIKILDDIKQAMDLVQHAICENNTAEATQWAMAFKNSKHLYSNDTASWQAFGGGTERQSLVISSGAKKGKIGMKLNLEATERELAETPMQVDLRNHFKLVADGPEALMQHLLQRRLGMINYTRRNQLHWTAQDERDCFGLPVNMGVNAHPKDMIKPPAARSQSARVSMGVPRAEADIGSSGVSAPSAAAGSGAPQLMILENQFFDEGTILTFARSGYMPNVNDWPGAIAKDCHPSNISAALHFNRAMGFFRETQIFMQCILKLCRQYLNVYITKEQFGNCMRKLKNEGYGDSKDSLFKFRWSESDKNSSKEEREARKNWRKEVRSRRNRSKKVTVSHWLLVENEQTEQQVKEHFDLFSNWWEMLIMSDANVTDAETGLGEQFAVENITMLNERKKDLAKGFERVVRLVFFFLRFFWSLS